MDAAGCLCGLSAGRAYHKWCSTSTSMIPIQGVAALMTGLAAVQPEKYVWG